MRSLDEAATLTFLHGERVHGREAKKEGRREAVTLDKTRR